MNTLHIPTTPTSLHAVVMAGPSPAIATHQARRVSNDVRRTNVHRPGLLSGANACHGCLPSIPVWSVVRPRGGTPLTCELGSRVLDAARLSNSHVGVAFTVARALRAHLNARKGVRMRGRVSPLTAQTIWAISDARMRATQVFLADGDLSAEEAAVLRTLDNAARMTERCDLARRVGDYIRDTGNIDEIGELVDLPARFMRQARELEAA